MKKKITIKFAEEWLNKLKYHWYNKEISEVLSLFEKTTYYQETPFMIPYTNINEIAKEWKYIIDEPIQEILFKILAIDSNVLIVEWYLKQNNEEYSGIYEIKFNENLDCIYFKSWEMEKPN